MEDSLFTSMFTIGGIFISLSMGFFVWGIIKKNKSKRSIMGLKNAITFLILGTIFAFIAIIAWIILFIQATSYYS